PGFGAVQRASGGTWHQDDGQIMQITSTASRTGRFTAMLSRVSDDDNLLMGTVAAPAAGSRRNVRP
ncbi:MAG: hypothetical protein KKE42_13585, partial [Alphaproteobacteria bacterium]|uniref:hypothetical protein n=1 Tax=Brevundimonas sp. TaxID=1871086 RepID=UPI001EB36343